MDAVQAAGDCSESARLATTTSVPNTTRCLQHTSSVPGVILQRGNNKPGDNRGRVTSRTPVAGFPTIGGLLDGFVFSVVVQFESSLAPWAGKTRAGGPMLHEIVPLPCSLVC
jgi:hypothetical protein